MRFNRFQNRHPGKRSLERNLGSAHREAVAALDLERDLC